MAFLRAAFLGEQLDGKLRHVLNRLTHDMETAVLAGLHAINHANDTPGATLVREAP